VERTWKFNAVAARLNFFGLFKTNIRNKFSLS